MASESTLHDAFVDELKDLYNAEKQLTRALPKMAKAATSPSLARAFKAHLEETRGHVDRLERVFDSLGESVRGKSTLAEEEATDERLSRLAEGGINRQAAAGAHNGDETGASAARTSRWRRGAKAPSRR